MPPELQTILEHVIEKCSALKRTADFLGYSRTQLKRKAAQAMFLFPAGIPALMLTDRPFDADDYAVLEQEMAHALGSISCAFGTPLPGGRRRHVFQKALRITVCTGRYTGRRTIQGLECRLEDDMLVSLTLLGPGLLNTSGNTLPLKALGTVMAHALAERGICLT